MLSYVCYRRFEALQRSTVIHQQPLIAPLVVETSASEELVIMENIITFEANGFRMSIDPGVYPLTHSFCHFDCLILGCVFLRTPSNDLTHFNDLILHALTHPFLLRLPQYCWVILLHRCTRRA